MLWTHAVDAINVLDVFCSSYNINTPHAPLPPLVAITITLGCATTVGWLLLILKGNKEGCWLN